jgi:endonuclease-3
MTKRKLQKIIVALENEYHSKTTGFSSKNILDVLIAIKLSQNTTDKSSYKAYTNLRNEYKNWEDVIDAPLSRIKDLIKVCGLANTKAPQIQNMLKEMKAKYGNLTLDFLHSKSNQDIYGELLQYNGLGVKTISCVLAFAMGRGVFPVDTHVHRILNRIGAVETNTAEKTFETATVIIPDEEKVSFHTNLIKFGRNRCRAVNPLCNICFIYKECEWSEKKFYKEANKETEVKENNFIIVEHI